MMQYTFKKWPPVPSSTSVASLGGDSGSCQQSTGGAKNLWGKKNHQTKLKIGTYNVRTLKTDDNITELIHELDDTNIKWDIIGIAEVRRQEEHFITLKSGHLLYHTNSHNGQQGVGFLINKKLQTNIIEVKEINTRMATLTIRINNRYSMKIIQVYAPTSTSTEDDIEKFYDELSQQLKTKSHYTIIMGDFNAQIGIKQDINEKCTGNFGSGTRNDRGDMMVDWASQHKLKIMNTFYKKKYNRRWTWRSPNGQTYNEIDYIITNKQHIFTDTTVINKVNIGSDHRLVMGSIRINTKMERQKLITHKTIKVDTNKIIENCNQLQITLHNRFQALNDNANNTIENLNTDITQILQESAQEVAKQKKNNTTSKLSQNTKTLIKKRREMYKTITNNNGNIRNNIEYAEICKTVKKKIRQDIREFNTNEIKTTIMENKSINKAKRSQTLGKDRLVCLLDKQGNEITNQDKLMERIHEFYSELYSSTDNQTVTYTSNTQLPEITAEEVTAALSKMKKGKATGNDYIHTETLQAGGRILAQKLAGLLTKCLQTRKIPTRWRKVDMILLFKKGNRKDMKNYRPICLLSNLYKLYTKIITLRLTTELDEQQPREQAGFRSQYSTMDHIHTLNQLREKCREHNIPLCLAFIDYEKAFDSVYTSKILKALKEQGIEEAYIEILQNIYTDSTVTVKMHKNTEDIKIEKGVKQGDPMSPKLFSAVLENIFRKLNWENKGINIDGEYLTNLRFADDLTITTSKPTDLQTMLQEIATRSEEYGLKMNTTKTKVMFGPLTAPINISVNNTNIEAVDEYIYLGQRFSLKDKNQDKEIQRRITAGWTAYAKHRDIFKSNIPISLKRKVYEACIIPAMTYAAETWSLTTKMENKLAAAQSKMERSMLGINYKDRKTNKWVRSQTKLKDIISIIKKLKWQWAGHIYRRNDNRWTIRITEWTPRIGKREKGRPQRRWRDELDKYWEKVNWEKETQNRKSWKHHGETFIQQWNRSEADR